MEFPIAVMGGLIGSRGAKINEAGLGLVITRHKAPLQTISVARSLSLSLSLSLFFSLSLQVRQTSGAKVQVDKFDVPGLEH